MPRLRWRCRRGMAELDVLMLRFLDQRWSDAADDERSLFLRLLDCEDDNLWRWFMGISRPDDKDLDGLVERIRQLPPRL